MKKTHNKDGPEPDVSFVDSMHFPGGSAAKPRDDTGREPRDDTAGKPRDGTGRKPRDETAGKPRDGTGRKPRDETAGIPHHGTGRKPRDETAGIPHDGTGRKPRDETAGRPRDGTGRKPRDETAGKTHDGSGRKPRDETARRPRDGTLEKFRNENTRRPRDVINKIPRDAIIRLEERIETKAYQIGSKLPGKPQIRGKTNLRRLKILGVNHPSGLVMAKLWPEVKDSENTGNENMRFFETRINTDKSDIKGVGRNTQNT